MRGAILGVVRQMGGDRPMQAGTMLQIAGDVARGMRDQHPDCFCDLTPLQAHDAWGTIMPKPITPLRQITCPACRGSAVTSCIVCADSGYLLTLR